MAHRWIEKIIDRWINNGNGHKLQHWNDATEGEGKDVTCVKLQLFSTVSTIRWSLIREWLKVTNESFLMRSFCLICSSMGVRGISAFLKPESCRSENRAPTFLIAKRCRHPTPRHRCTSDLWATFPPHAGSSLKCRSLKCFTGRLQTQVFFVLEMFPLFLFLLIRSPATRKVQTDPKGKVSRILFMACILS